MRRVEVLVIGAGVAGAYAAMRLSREGVRVALMDKAGLPRHKVCGCCLNAEAVGLLTQAGLGAELADLGARPIERVSVCSGGHAISLASRGGVALSRYALDAMLADQAEAAGCELLRETAGRVAALPTEPGEPVVVHCTGRGVGGRATIEARVVIAADGLAGSSLANIAPAARKVRHDSHRGYGAQLPPGAHDRKACEVVMRCGAGGYVGTVVLEDGTLDVAAAMRPAWVKAHGGPGAAAARLSESSGDPLPGLDRVPWRATAPLTGHRRHLSLPGVLVVGDAAGYIEPFTGEGMAWAMRSADLAVPFALRALGGWSPGLERDWQRAYRVSVQRRQWRCRLFSVFLRHARLTTGLVAAGSRLPGAWRSALSRVVLPSMNDHRAPASIPQSPV